VEWAANTGAERSAEWPGLGGAKPRREGHARLTTTVARRQLDLLPCSNGGAVQDERCPYEHLPAAGLIAGNTALQTIRTLRNQYERAFTESAVRRARRAAVEALWNLYGRLDWHTGLAAQRHWLCHWLRKCESAAPPDAGDSAVWRIIVSPFDLKIGHAGTTALLSSDARRGVEGLRQDGRPTVVRLL
jgi:hypothetical protein